MHHVDSSGCVPAKVFPLNNSSPATVTLSVVEVKTTLMSFLVAGGLTSAVDVMSDEHKRRIEHDTKTYGTTDTWDGVGNTIETNCTTINHLLDSIGVRHVDYFSLDVEGAEILVLESIAFSEVTVDVFTIEKQEHREQVQTFMKGIGYRIIEDSENKLSLDDVYVRDDIVIA